MKHLKFLAAALVLAGAGCMTNTVPDGSGAAGTQLEGTPQVNDTPEAKFAAPRSAEDAVYIVDGAPVSLHAGVAEEKDAPDAASSTVTRVFGEPVRADLDADGDMDAAVMLERSVAGSGRFYYVAAAITEEGYVRGTEAILLGDRIAPQTLEVMDGVILANYADRKPGEPMTADPSVGVTARFQVEKGELVSVR